MGRSVAARRNLYLGTAFRERWHKRVISATAASKTFGLSSLRISNFLIPDPTLRLRFLSRLDAHGLDVFNALSVQAATTAWNESRQWLDSLLDYWRKTAAGLLNRRQSTFPGKNCPGAGNLFIMDGL